MEIVLGKNAALSVVQDEAAQPAPEPVAPIVDAPAPVTLTPKQRIAAAFADLSAQGVTPYIQRQFDDFLNIIMRDYE